MKTGVKKKKWEEEDLVGKEKKRLRHNRKKHRRTFPHPHDTNALSSHAHLPAKPTKNPTATFDSHMETFIFQHRQRQQGSSNLTDNKGDPHCEDLPIRILSIVCHLTLERLATC